MPASEHQTAALPFTGMALDRAATERHDPAWVQRLLEDPATRVVAAGRSGVLVTDGDNPVLLRLRAELEAAPPPEPILLGLEDGRAVFARDLDALAQAVDAEHSTGGRVISLREAGAELPYAEAGLAAYATALLNWHRTHRFCANCGAATAIAEGGHSRRCPRCEAVHFPRTDPCVIMTVEHEGRLLLGRRVGWPPGRLSVLAGFVSPGEAAEEAVVREVREESGIVARDPIFVASQPWPFPVSLMLGFHAQSDGGDPQPRDGELEEVHWFTVDGVREAFNDGTAGFRPPPPLSIARFLIERWVAGHEG